MATQTKSAPRRVSMLGLGEAVPETEPASDRNEPTDYRTLMQEMEERLQRNEDGSVKYIDHKQHHAMTVRAFDKKPAENDLLGQAVFMRVGMNKKKKAQENKDRLFKLHTRAAIKMQAAARGRAVRGAMHSYKVETANEKGEMLAMPGTTLGQSGWYQQGVLVYKFDVTADGEFVQLNDGVDEPHWRRMHLLELAEENIQKGQQKYGTTASGTAALQQRREQNEVDRLIAGVENQFEILLPLVLKVQAVARGLLGRLKARQVALDQANGEGAMLAMPGTVQGGTGWYQAGDLVFRYEVLPEGDFQQVGDPILVRSFRLMMIRRQWAHNGRPTTSERQHRQISMNPQQQQQQHQHLQAKQQQLAPGGVVSGSYGAAGLGTGTAPGNNSEAKRRNSLTVASSLVDGWGGGEDGAAATMLHSGTSVSGSSSSSATGRPGSGGVVWEMA